MEFGRPFGFLTICVCVALLAGCGGGEGGLAQPRSSGPESEASILQEVQDAAPVSRFNSADAVTVTAESLAEQSTSAQPAAIRRLRQARPDLTGVPVIELGEADARKLQELEVHNKQAQTGVRPKVHLLGYVRRLAAEIPLNDPLGRWTWSWSEDGQQREAVLALSSSEAKGLRLGLRVGSLPAGVSVKVYGEQALEGVAVDAAMINQSVTTNLAADPQSLNARTFWMPMAEGQTAYLAVTLPVSVEPSLVDLAVTGVGHASETTLGLAQKNLQAKSACPGVTPDATCTMPPAMNAVAQYDWIMPGGGMGACTGSLINDRPNSANHYFLTANHCISTQEEATSIVLYWGYRSQSCNSTTLNPDYTTTMGSTLLFVQTEYTVNLRNQVGIDTALVRLSSPPPANSIKAGWVAGGVPVGTGALASIHHPAMGGATAFLARISTGSMTGFGALINDSTVQTSVTNTSLPMYRVAWSSGITESGSSGAPLYLGATTNNPQVVGQLWGGSSTCSNPAGNDFFGRFDLGYQDGMINWLNPGYSVVFRFFRPGTGTHFYSGNVQERNQVRATIPSYNYEGAAYLVSSSSAGGATAVYRFLRPDLGVHFYTISLAERNLVMGNPSYQYEGVAWYARAANNPINGVTIPIYRFYRPASGTHFYTASQAERDSIMANQAATLTYEGVAYHAWPYN